ncbi:MAG: SRPBCC family protein [Candidatus Diapherotrites archaeon]|nr:SRPBCC family protein [Candidatus Diapherotrites archaeon]
MPKNSKSANQDAIRQTVLFDASPHDVFELLMDSKKHSEFTESKCVISRKVGGKISAYDGYISGKNLEVIADKKIVQEWSASDWPEGTVSIATFEFKPKGTKTELVFTQTGVPADFVDDITSGWHEHYWDKMKLFLRNRPK